LETFDPAAFEAGADVPQEVCSLILALALVYNDYKDALFASIAIGDAKPTGTFRKSRIWGAHAGIEFHALRLQVGLLHELLNLLRESGNALLHPFIAKVVKLMPSNARGSWKSLVSVAMGSTPTDQFGRSLLLIRNKVSFHYDPKAIFSGYRHHFLGSTKRDDRAFISRGQSMSATRFYFADAAPIGYLRSLVGDEGSDELLKSVAQLVRTVNIALKYVVEGFIQCRGMAYRSYSE